MPRGPAKGNQFWKLRLKHGRNHSIATHEELEENFIEYCEWLENNPLIQIDFRGGAAKKVSIPKMRPMTKEGFALACGVNGWEVIEKWKARSNDFNDVITRIEKNIYNQKFEGAAAGFLNPNIIARDLGLVEKKEIDNTHDFKNLPPWMTLNESEPKAPDS